LRFPVALACARIDFTPPLAIAEDFAAACTRTLLLVATELAVFFFLAGNFGVVVRLVDGFEIAVVVSAVLVAERTTFFAVAFLGVAAEGSLVLLADLVLADLVTGICLCEAATFI
jgi:hypothetical protein